MILDLNLTSTGGTDHPLYCIESSEVWREGEREVRSNHSPPGRSEVEGHFEVVTWPSKQGRDGQLCNADMGKSSMDTA